MDKIHLSVTAVLLLYFNHPGSAGTKSQQLLNTHHRTDCWWDEKFVVNCSLMGLAAVPEDISLTAVTADFSYNNIKTFPCSTGRNEDWMLKHLNLSNNLISEISITAFRSLPVLETLNLNGNSISTLTLDPPTPETLGEIHHFLPALKVLSAKRNNLHAVPTGLGLLQSLQTVHLSFNGILQIDRNDFHNCSQLKNIYLQNNKIANIHPAAFKDLNKLQVVDLRENPLATILPHLLINMNIFQLKVDLFNSSWICNCRLYAFKHLLRFLSASMRKKLMTSCSKSATSSQKPLLYLSSFHLNCSDVLFRTVVVPPRETSVLRCSVGNTLGNGVSWWAPKGRISEESSLPHLTLDNNNLVIHNAEKSDEGLYVCTFNTTRKKYLIYNVQVKERAPASLVRKTRATNAGVRAGGTQQDLMLAVCLSVFITFLFAFCLGALARPCLTRLWMRMCKNKAPAPEHIYANHAFSDETLSREHSTSKPVNTQHNMFVSYENSSRNTHASPAGTAQLYEDVIGGTGRTPRTEEFPKQSNNEINIGKNTVSSNTKTNSCDAMYINTGQLTARMDYESSDEVTPRKLMGNSLSPWEDPKYTNSTDSEQSRVPPIPSRHNTGSQSVHVDPADTDLPCTGDAGFPLPTVQPQTSVQDSRDSEVVNSSGQQQSEATPEYKGNNINTNSDVGDHILPSSSKRDANIENLSVHQKPEDAPHTDHSHKRDCRNEQGNFADFFGDSSSDEGTPFTMSDCSSLEDFDLEQPSVSSNLPTPLVSVEKADTDGIGHFSPPLESLSIAAELRHIGKNGDKHSAYFGTTTDYGSDTIMPEAASAHATKGSDHVRMSGSDTISSSPEAPDAFDYYNKESTAQNSVSDSPYKHITDFSDTSLSLKHPPTYATDTENTPDDAELQPHQFSFQPQHLLRHSPTEQKEQAPEESTEQLTDESSSESDHGEGDIALRWNTNASENDHFVCTLLDPGLNATVTKAPLLHASTAGNKSLHPSLPENATENPPTVIMEKESLPQGEYINSAWTHEDKTERGFSEECDEYRELQGSSNCSSSDEMQSCSVMTTLHLESPGKTQSVFNTESYFQLDPSEENVYSSPVPPSSLSRSTQRSSGLFPQKTAGNKTFPTTDPSELEDDASLTAPENSSTTAASLPDSSERLRQRPQTSLGQGRLFIKKKRAFDGFANILQSRRADSDG
ncbi:leucine-rich repeat-containing protein 66 [Excalfactoria chinensis]|uniref:leucine-rich repeat-containing protein 66 n=1 Tax=Excalfactoria chinensis TaxID=46218 RepID=UPI003B3BC738